MTGVHPGKCGIPGVVSDPGPGPASNTMDLDNGCANRCAPVHCFNDGSTGPKRGTDGGNHDFRRCLGEAPCGGPSLSYPGILLFEGSAFVLAAARERDLVRVDVLFSPGTLVVTHCHSRLAALLSVDDLTDSAPLTEDLPGVVLLSR